MNSFLGSLNKAILTPSSEFPKPPPRTVAPRSAINDDLREKLRELRNAKADELGIDSGLLAKQSQLNTLADTIFGSWENRLEKANFMKWQQNIWRDLIPLAKLPKTPQEFRTWAKDKLAAMSHNARTAESEDLVAVLSKHPVLEEGFIAAFFPNEFEPDIRLYLQKLCEENRLLLPRIIKNANGETSAEMEFVFVGNLNNDLEKGSFGIFEPHAGLPSIDKYEPPIIPSAFLVPGVVFGKDCGRIGHGKGYYDRCLSQFKNVPRLGIAYSAQVRSTLPQSATDVKMNEVVYCK
ncbi:hypothetical protein AGMMS49938_11060 [Fibrobacterales bacterium]|nr:hypothetical protein AGMMS49938_11060 [Fibrobacterales bacterium]